MALLISDKVDSTAKKITRIKERCYIMMKDQSSRKNNPTNVHIPKSLKIHKVKTELER